MPGTHPRFYLPPVFFQDCGCVIDQLPPPAIIVVDARQRLRGSGRNARQRHYFIRLCRGDWRAVSVLQLRRRHADFMKLPFVFINMAMTTDGKIATANRAVSTFSSKHDFKHLLELRATADAVTTRGENEIDFRGALEWLSENWNVQRLLCEGGGELNGALFRAGLVNELHLTICPKIFGGRNAPTIADGTGMRNLAGATLLK